MTPGSDAGGSRARAGTPRRPSSPRAGRPAARAAICGALALAAAGAACGKKGPPLAPFVRIPAAVETIDARRVGDDVYVGLGVPAQNIDASAPADLARVQVYGYTGTAAPPRARFVESAGVVASFDVAPPAEPGEPAPAAVTAPAQGARVTVRDTLTREELLPAPSAGTARAADAAGPEPSGSAGPAAGDPSAQAAPRRFYMAIAFSRRGVPGPPGAIVELPLTVLPDPPAALQARYTADALTLTWEPPGGIVAFLLTRALPPDPAPPGVEAPAPEVPLPPPPEGPALYNVYREIAPDPLALPAADAGGAPRDAAPAPVNAMPLAALTWTEPIALDERERCYVVRTVRGTASQAVESGPSSRTCVTPFDVFAPAMPADLAAIASENAISLIWEPVADPDLGGYLVLRGEAGGDRLAPLTPEPIPEAQFTDDRVMPGVRYVYHVIAVDRRVPLPNASAPAMIEETAR